MPIPVPISQIALAGSALLFAASTLVPLRAEPPATTCRDDLRQAGQAGGTDDGFRRLVRRYAAGECRSSDDLAAVAAALAHLGRHEPSRFHDALRVYDEAVAADPSNFDALVELGDLFLGKYNGEGARESYEKVLKQDPEHPGALVGMARVKRFDS